MDSVTDKGCMYEDVSTKVRMNERESGALTVKVGVHQGSVLSHCCSLGGFV